MSSQMKDDNFTTENDVVSKSVQPLPMYHFQHALHETIENSNSNFEVFEPFCAQKAKCVYSSLANRQTCCMKSNFYRLLVIYFKQKSYVE